MLLLTLALVPYVVSVVLVDLNAVLRGVDMHSDNLTLTFKNLNVQASRVSFDELYINGMPASIGGNFIQSCPENEELRPCGSACTPQCSCISGFARSPTGLCVQDLNATTQQTLPTSMQSIPTGATPQMGVTSPPFPTTSSVLGIDTATTTSSGPRVIRYTSFATSTNDSVSPCDDFYAHVCDGWLAENPLNGGSSMTQFNIANSVVAAAKYSFLTEKNSSATREQQLAKDYFRKCVDRRGSTDDTSFMEMMVKLQVARGDNETTPLNAYLTAFAPQGFLFSADVGVDERNSSRYILQVRAMPSIVNHKAYTNNEFAYEYVAMRKLLCQVLDYAARDEARLDYPTPFLGTAMDFINHVESFFTIDRFLAQNSQTNQFNATTAFVNVSELAELVTTVDWEIYLATILRSEALAVVNAEEIQIVDVNAVKMLDAFLRGVDPKTVQLYLDNSVLFSVADNLDSRYQEAFGNYTLETTGEGGVDAESECLASTSTSFADIIDGVFIERNFAAETREKVQIMVGDILSTFADLLMSNDWMDPVTKQRARSKLLAINKFIGYNDDVLNHTALAEKYNNVDVSLDDTYYSVNEKLKMIMWDQSVSKLGTFRDNQQFEFIGSDVNSYYDPTTNSIAILAGMLQEPFFSTALPEFMNYGGIGTIIAHEFTHGFDVDGSKYDEVGNKLNWWEQVTRENFERRTVCMRDEYSSITIPGTNATVDGQLTLNENIADNGGMRTVIRAAQRLGSTGDVIEGLENRTPLQLFFMSYAYMWCGASDQRDLLSSLNSDVHAPGKYRVNVVLQNQPEFAQAFNCPIGSPMNPVTKCTVW